jgi:hypothetical protein
MDLSGKISRIIYGLLVILIKILDEESFLNIRYTREQFQVGIPLNTFVNEFEINDRGI